MIPVGFITSKRDVVLVEIIGEDVAFDNHTAGNSYSLRVMF